MKAELSEDMFIPEPYVAFIADPEGKSAQDGFRQVRDLLLRGCPHMINSGGLLYHRPIGMYQIGDPRAGCPVRRPTSTRCCFDASLAAVVLTR